MGMDGAVGKRFSQHVTQQCRPDCTYLWSPVNKNREFEQVTQEGSARRYYIYWNKICLYSLLVSSDDRILSWRYETKETGSCYVF